MKRCSELDDTGARRKKKAVHKTATSDDKKLMTTLKKLGVTAIPAIEEVNMFKENGEVIHFVNPKVCNSTRPHRFTMCRTHVTTCMTMIVRDLA